MKAVHTSNDHFVKTLKWLMIFAGFWKMPLSKNPFLNKLYMFYSKGSKIYMFLFIILLAMELFRLIKDQENSKVIITSFCVMVSCILIAVKLYIIIKRNLADLIQEIIIKEEEIWKSDDEEVKDIFTRKAYFCNVLCAGLTMVQVVCLASMSAMAFIGDQELIEYNRVHNTTLDTYYWYQLWFPGVKLDHLGWVYTLNGCFGWIACSNSMVCHSLLATLMIFASTKMEILCAILRKCVKGKIDVDLDRNIFELKRCVVEHQDIIEYVTRLNKSISLILLLHFLLNSVEISSCVTSYLKGSVPMLQQIFLASYVTLTVYQILMASWNANEIQHQSTKIADAFYEINWLLLNKDGKTICLISAHRAQKPLSTTLGPFGAMTNQSGLLVIKAAYSYVSVMNTGTL
ncbi:odorant receptor 49b-like [Sitophilus oryzae]|uniref:Odorant receptor n=1 Tax=Sitophilus oryzae TaxID=7048 RepID=A0A6J2Y568_SITOR|nr:odorant receptor 49b-like [Sitophilus oryzae]